MVEAKAGKGRKEEVVTREIHHQSSQALAWLVNLLIALVHSLGSQIIYLLICVFSSVCENFPYMFY